MRGCHLQIQMHYYSWKRIQIIICREGGEGDLDIYVAGKRCVWKELTQIRKRKTNEIIYRCGNTGTRAFGEPIYGQKT